MSRKNNKQNPCYWRLIEQVSDSVSIYDGPEIFLRQFGRVRIEAGNLFAAVWVQTEVCNGGFSQFFTNSTGVLAPEALNGLRVFGINELARILDEAMQFWGEPYPRDRRDRESIWDSLGSAFSVPAPWRPSTPSPAVRVGLRQLREGGNPSLSNGLTR